MTGAGGGMGFESFKQMLPDLGTKYDLVVLVRDSDKNHELFDKYENKRRLISANGGSTAFLIVSNYQILNIFFLEINIAAPEPRHSQCAMTYRPASS